MLVVRFVPHHLALALVADGDRLLAEEGVSVERDAARIGLDRRVARHGHAGDFSLLHGLGQDAVEDFLAVVEALRLGDVAGGPDAVDAAAHGVVDENAAVERHAGTGEVVGDRRHAGGDEQQVGIERRAAVRRHSNGFSRRLAAADFRPEQQLDALGGEGGLDDGGCLGVEVAGEHARLHFHHGDLGAGFGEVLGGVHANEPRAEHDGLLRLRQGRVQADRVVERAQDVELDILQAGNRRQQRRGASGEQQLAVGNFLAAGQARAPGGGVDRGHGGATDEADLVLLEPGAVLQRDAPGRGAAGHHVGQHGGRIRQRVVARHHSDAALGVLHADGLQGGECRVAGADDEVLGLLHIRPRNARHSGRAQREPESSVSAIHGFPLSRE